MTAPGGGAAAPRRHGGCGLPADVGPWSAVGSGHGVGHSSHSRHASHESDNGPAATRPEAAAPACRSRPWCRARCVTEGRRCASEDWPHRRAWDHAAHAHRHPAARTATEDGGPRRGRHRPPGPPHEEPDQAAAARRHRGHRPRRHRPGQRRRAGRLQGGRGRQRRAEHLRPLSEPRPRDPARRRHPAARRRRQGGVHPPEGGRARPRSTAHQLLAEDGTVLAEGIAQDDRDASPRRWPRRKAGLSVQLEAFAANTMEYMKRERALLLDGVGVPDVATADRGPARAGRRPRL